MRTSRIGITLAALTIACSGEEGPCDSYRFSDGLYGYCVRSISVNMPTMSKAGEACSMPSAASEAECRSAWMDIHVGRTGDSRADLLQFCRSDDCRMLVLDLQPADDLLRQLEDCELAGRYSADCMGHARQRWFLAKPTAEELRRVSLRAGPFGREISEWVGEAIRCGTAGDCSSTPQPDLCIAAAKGALGPGSCGSSVPNGSGESVPPGTSAPWSFISRPSPDKE